MNAPGFLTNVAIVVALMGLASFAEMFVPLRASVRTRGRVATNLTLTTLVFALNWAGSAAMMFAMSDRGSRPLVATRRPMLLQIAISIVVLDFFTYLAHMTMHKVPLLWRIHRVHHSDPFVDATTSFRFHPLEALWRYAWIVVPAWALGMPAQGIVFYRLVSAVNGVFEHANVRVRRSLDRVLTWIWVTPNVHKVHHSSERVETDSNYGNILSLYDHLSRTFAHSRRQRRRSRAPNRHVARAPPSSWSGVIGRHRSSSRLSWCSSCPSSWAGSPCAPEARPRDRRDRMASEGGTSAPPAKSAAPRSIGRNERAHFDLEPVEPFPERP